MGRPGSMNLRNQVEIARYHQDRISNFGSGTAQALGWKSEQGQLLRFQALSTIGNLSGCSVLDVGCGHGDLHDYLSKLFPDIHYTGVELSQTFLNLALDRYGGKTNTRFLMGDFSTDDLPVSDYVLASGVLNYRSEEPDWVFKMITRLFTTCRLGLGFNLLSQVEGEGILAAYEPEIIMAHCREFSFRTRLVENYLEGDFTVFLYKAGS
jgi:SAM-dependent methyltransferase